MKNFRFTKPRGTQNVALVVEDTTDARRFTKVYSSDELYPLNADRYYTDLPNLFVDVLDVAEGEGPEMEEASATSKVLTAPSITLRTLTRRAQRSAADGSGNAQRFADAKDLWNKMESHILSAVVKPDDKPITDVRKSKNWRKSQPFADVAADPQAWFVTDVFSRSNQQKNPIDAYRGLSAVFDALLEGLDDLAAADLLTMKTGICENLSFPTYAQISRALNDSNMLVFHNDTQLAEWIRAETHKKEYLYSGTPVIVHLPQGKPSIPGDSAERKDLDLESGATVTVSNLANRLAPKGKAR
ncbi:MAG: hypothetical protein LKJ44_03160 [Bifidobacteriaceae bacterium]|jgi:hypothetical protein|nr:hypothetical protein [Bifidobacteriaceae bacterium]MCI1978700.1 hypothetical protein [Bifidobacteriaceae bacterium]